MSKQRAREDRGIMDRARSALGIQTQEPPVRPQGVTLQDRMAAKDEDLVPRTGPERAGYLRQLAGQKRREMTALAEEAEAIDQEADTLEAESASAAQESAMRKRQFWPKDRPMPEAYLRRQVLPCPRCSRVLTAAGGQAVVTRGIAKSMAYLYCKACGNEWKLSVREAS